MVYEFLMTLLALCHLIPHITYSSNR